MATQRKNKRKVWLWTGLIVLVAAVALGIAVAARGNTTKFEPSQLGKAELADIIGNREVFALEVRGDSMRDEHIVSGDYVLVERTRTAREGEIIVALIDGADATLKRFYREGSMIRLQPSNTEMSPIYAPAANVSIQGKVLGVLR